MTINMVITSIVTTVTIVIEVAVLGWEKLFSMYKLNL